MSTNIDWHEEIDTSFGQAPDRPPTVYAAAGRRALRRRRLAAGAAALSTAVVLGGIGWAMTPGGDATGSEAPIAVDPTTGVADAEAEPSEPPQRSRELPWRANDPPARALPSQGLEIRKGAIVHERRDDVYPDKESESAALDLSFKGKRWWVVLEWDDGGSAMSSSMPGGAVESFDAFVAGAVADGGMFTPTEEELDAMQPLEGLVDYSTQGLEVGEGVKVVRRVENPLALEAPRTSLGVVLEHEGTTTWMLLTADGGGSGSSSEDAARSGWRTFDEWLDAQVALQSGEPGQVLVTLADDGTVRPVEPGVEILDQRADPDLPAYVDESTDDSAVAMLRWRGDTWFVLIVRYAGQEEDSITMFAASKTDGADDIDSFLAFARDQADEGGLR